MGEAITQVGPLSQLLGVAGTAILVGGAAAALGLIVAESRRFTATMPANPGADWERREVQTAGVLAACLAGFAIAVEQALDFAPARVHQALGMAIYCATAFLACRASRLPLVGAWRLTINLAVLPPIFLVREWSENRVAWNMFGALMMLVTVVGVKNARERDREKERTTLLRRLSHNLRTPAAGIRSLAEALERNDVADPAERARCLALIRGEADRLSVGLDRMLRAAKGDVRTAPAPVALDLAEWVRAAEARWRTRLPGLTLEATSPLPATADPELLDEAVDALLDNAMRYGAPGVALQVARGSDAVTIAVEDGGPGPAAERRAELERTLAGGAPSGGAEASSGTASPDGKGGYGLGLWAAGEVARAHRGAASLEGRSRFVLRFPAEPPRVDAAPAIR